MKTWIDLQSPEWRAGVHTVVIDPSAPYAAGIRACLPHSQIAVDHFHLVQLANQMVTEVRRRVARERHGRRGLATDAAWAHRQMLLTAGDRLSKRQLARLKTVLATDDPTNEIGAAWGCKELLRQLLAARDPWDIRDRLWRFHNACAEAYLPEAARLAATIDTWWPHIMVFLKLRVTNARTEGFNRNPPPEQPRYTPSTKRCLETRCTPTGFGASPTQQLWNSVVTWSRFLSDFRTGGVFAHRNLGS